MIMLITKLKNPQTIIKIILIAPIITFLLKQMENEDVSELL